MSEKLVFGVDSSRVTFRPRAKWNDDGSTTMPPKLPFLEVSEWVGNSERAAKAIAEILDRHYPRGHLYRQSLADVLAERQRQSDQEGYTSERDNGYNQGQLARAAACYALRSAYIGASNFWPWEPETWKPKHTRRDDLVKAGALILAEIDRLDRMEQAEREGAQ